MRKLIGVLAILALFVIALGAYTRLSDAGLGCPDWPGCYGQLAVPGSSQAILQAETNFNQSLEPQKAWTEMIHRYVAGTLALGVLLLLILSVRQGLKTRRIPWLPIILAVVVVLQALLGMWTVTMKLYPPIILMHLFGGITILSLLWWQGLQLNASKKMLSPKLQPWLWLGFGLLLVQIALGGWTSANYAALICPDFPYCQGQWLPELSWQAFLHSTGIAASNTTLVTIHMAHRFGAVIAGGYLLSLSVIMILKQRQFGSLKWGLILGTLVVVQICLGMLNIVLLLPMYTAVAHNVTAVLLVVTLLSIVGRCRPVTPPLR